MVKFAIISSVQAHGKMNVNNLYIIVLQVGEAETAELECGKFGQVMKDGD